MSDILDTQTWSRTITRTYVDFKTLSLVGINGGGYNGGTSATSLKCFGKPDYQENCDHLCYLDLGLEFMLNSNNKQIAYIYIYIRSHNHSYFKSLPFHFQAFTGNFFMIK